MGWGQGKGKSKRLNSPSKNKTRPKPLAVESLEPRQLLSAAQTLVNPAWIITNDTGPAGLSAGDTVSDGATHTGATYLVDAFSTVQEGIDNVDPGGEVLILPGNYSGTITINKAVKITALSGAITTNLSIDLNSGADCSGSSGVAAGAVRVHVGAHVSDGVLLAGAGATVTVDSGTYSDNVTLTRSIKLLSNGGPVTVNSFTLASTASLISGTTGVTATSVSVNSGAKIQDAITLASSTQLTTITVAATTSSETVTINKPITFSGACTVTKFILSAGASIPTPSLVTSITITMNAGVKLQDALNLSSTTVQTAIALPTGANTFNETATISKNVKLTATATTTIAAVILASGESITITSNITCTNITVNNGGKVADALKLASSSAMSTLTIDPGTYPESITLGKSVRFNSSGAATISSFNLALGAIIDPLSSGVSSTSITVSISVSLQDALRLASPTAQTTLFLQGSNYAETITLSSPVRFSGTAATIDGVILNSGASVAAGSIASSLNITVNSGAKISDALALASTAPGFESLITVAAGDYAEDAAINTSIQFAGGPATLHSITLAGGAVIDALSTGVTSPLVIVSGGKVKDALRLASVGTAATPSEVSLTSAAYAEAIQMPAKFIRFSSIGGPATLTSITLGSGAAIDAASTGVTAPLVNVNTGARVQDAILLVGGGSSQVKLQDGDYSDAVTVAKPVKFTATVGATIAGITLAAGASITGSSNVSSTNIHVTGGTLADALALASPSNLTTTLITLNAGNYNESPTIAARRVKLATPSGIATITGTLTLDTGEIIDPASANVYANTVVINQTNGTVKVQDGVILGSNGGTLKLKAGAYADSVTISGPMKFATVSGVATIAAIALNSGANLAASANVTSANISVNGGLVADAMLLAATGTLASPSAITLTAPTYAETVTLPAKFLRLNSPAGSTINSILLATGVSIDAGSAGVTSTHITLSSGVKLQDAIALASNSALSTITLAAASYAETLSISKNLQFIGSATATAITLNSGGNISSPSGLTSSNVTVNNGASIQAGIAAIVPGATLTVNNGTYAGDLTIDKSLTLAGPQAGVDAGRNVPAGSEAIIAGTVSITSAATNVTIDGFTIDRGAHGALLTSSATGLATVRNNIINSNYATGSDTQSTVNIISGASVALSHNKITTSAAAPIAIAYNPATTSISVSNNDLVGLLDLSGLGGADVAVDNNTIHNLNGDGILLASGTVHDISITGNQLNNNAAAGLIIDGAALVITGAQLVSLNTFSGNLIGASISNLSGIAISDNQFTANTAALAINNVSNLAIALNTISANATGIDITGSGSHDIFIHNNFIQNNHNFAGTAGYGIHIAAGAIADSSLQVSDNSITGNFIGIANDASPVVSATMNWWGSASGPQAPDNFDQALPHGDAITGNVLYTPWQTQSTDTSATDGFQPTAALFAPVTNSEGESYPSIQEALDGTDAGGTLTIAAGNYAESIAISKPVTLMATGGSATIAAITLENGARLGPGSAGIASAFVAVHNGAIAQDGITLAAPGATVALQSGMAFAAQDLTLSKPLTLTQTGSIGVQLRSITLNSGAALTPASSGVDSLLITLNNGARLSDAIHVAAIDATITLATGTFTGDTLIDKSLTLNGNQSGVDARTRTGLAADESRLTGALTIASTAVNVIIDGVTVDNGKPDRVIVSHATGALTFRNNVVNANYAPAASFSGPTIAIDNAFDATLARNKIITFRDTSAANLSVGFAPQNGFAPVSHSVTLSENDIAGSIALAGLNGASVDLTANNIHNGSADGVSLSDAAVNDVTIFANTITYNFAAALRIDALAITGQLDIGSNTLSQNQTGLHLSGSLADTSIHKNFITNNTADGILIDSSTTSPVAIHQNYISGNGTGLRNQSTQTIDATANYWGSDNGPATPLNTWNGAPGGDSIFGENVQIAPWYIDGADTDLDAPGYQPVSLDNIIPSVSAPDLADQSDSGYRNSDNITNNNTPTFTGSADPGASVNLFEDSTLLGATQADNQGNWSITLPSPLGDGTHNLTARATNQSGNTALSAALTIVIDTAAPVPSAGSPQTVNENDSVTLAGTFSDPAGVAPYFRSWHFAGTTNSQFVAGTSGDMLSFQAFDNGVYTFRYDVTDAAGNSASDFVTVTVNNISPTAEITGLPDTEIPTGVAVPLTATALDPGTFDSLTYLWTVTKTKNGITTPFATQAISATMSRTDAFTFTPDQAATYNLSLTVTDKDGDSTTTTASITAVEVAPTVTLTGSRSNAANPLPNVAEAAPFTLTLGPATDPTTEYHIHWGDDSDETILTEAQLSAAGRQVTHIYTDGFAAADAAPTHTVTVDLLTDGGTRYYPEAATLGIVVYDTPPAATLSGSSTVNEGSSASLLVFSPADPSAIDAAAGYTYSFDFNNDGIFELNNLSAPSVTIPASYLADGPFDRTIAARIYDKDGFFTQYTRTIHVSNIAPTLNIGGPALITQNAPFIRAAFFADPGADTWTATADYGDGSGPQPLTLNSNKSFTLSHTYAAPGTYTVTVHLTDKDLAAAVSSFDITVQPTTLQVTDFTPTASGVDIRFNRAIDLSVLNLYDVNPLAQPDLTLTGAVTGPVRGSAILDAATNTLHFIKTGAPLAADRYTLALSSRADAFIDLAGSLLDGDANNTPGGDYIQTFTATPAAFTLTLPDFARGPSQSIDLPITLSNAQDVQSADFDLHYNPALLNITAAQLSDDMPSGWTLTANNTPGLLHISLSGTAPLPAGVRDLIQLIADVPSSAPYKSSDSLTLTGVRLNEGAIPAAADTAVHKTVYFGDASGDGTIGAFDANRISRVVTQLNATFAAGDNTTAYPLTDPLIVADITGDGTLSGLDAALVAEKFTDPAAVPQIPDVPAGPAPAPAAIDPTLALPNLTARPGSTIDIPLSISQSAGFFAADITLAYDNALLDLTRADLTADLAAQGWALTTHAAGGQVRLSLYSTGQSLSAGAPNLLNLTFHISRAAPDNQSLPLHIVATPDATRLNENQLALSTQDGAILIDATPPSVASFQFLYEQGQSIAIDFSENISTLSASDFTLLNLTTNRTIPAENLALSFTGQSATLTFANLPDGRYTLTLNSADVTDLAGNPLTDTAPLSFFTLAGDADHDASVGFSDLVIVAQHYGQSDPALTWSTGDFNHDGQVNFADLVTVAQHYGNNLAPITPQPAPLPITAPTTTITSRTESKPAPVAAPANAPVSKPITRAAPATPLTKKPLVVVASQPRPAAIPAAPLSPAKKPPALIAIPKTPFATTSRIVARPAQNPLLGSPKKRSSDSLFL